MTALATARAAQGLGAYLGEVEVGLEAAVGRYPGLAARAGSDALGGGKRLRPLLVFLAAPVGVVPPVEAGVAVELVHMATLLHDDMIDRAALRHGRPAIWSVHGDDVAVATGDYLFARAFGELAETGGLKTGKLFEAACRLAGGCGPFGLALGIAYQIADDVLDCTGDASDTGKVPGTDLREGTPTLPLLLAARADPVVRDALAGGPLEGALVRVAATGALEESRAVARDYAARARAALNGALWRDELEALTYAAVDRTR